ncbi:MAG: class I SAM-dependent methyltransferase [Gemmatimonadales bacterium]|jgi:cyclopropane-fatty-acyl-phospholipid synthase
MTFTSTVPLRRQIERVFPDRPFAIQLWDGSSIPATADGAPTVTARSPRVLGHLLRAPGQLGLGRAYVAGDIVVDDLDAVVDVAETWHPPALTRRMRTRLLLAAARARGRLSKLPPPTAELRPRGALHSRTRDAEAVRHHYDVSNEFFALFLDQSMTYSCAFFSRDGTSLESAQQAKLELTCQKLALEPGQRVLDVGCGWGAFAIHAASHHGVQVVGITLSEPQASLARERVRAAGLTDRVSIRVQDYRDLAGERFDAIASIGMVEHVGASRIDLYARQLAGLLRAGGRLLNHGIARLYDASAGIFTMRYVFPDSDPLPLSRVQLALERAGFITEHVEGFQMDYAETLGHWIRRLDEHREEAIRLAGEERVRVWRLYLRGARKNFEDGFLSIYQVRCRLGGG